MWKKLTFFEFFGLFAKELSFYKKSSNQKQISKYFIYKLIKIMAELVKNWL